MTTQSTWRSNHANTNGPRWGPNNPAASNQSRTANNGNAGSFPPLGNKPGHSAKLNEEESLMRDRMLYVLVGLVGEVVEVKTRSGNKYVGILSTTSSPENDSESGLGVVLSCAQQILSEDKLGPLQKTLMIKGSDLNSISASEIQLDMPLTANHSDRTGFRTDTQISNSIDTTDQSRSLQKWDADTDIDLALEITTGPSSNSLGGWDQFAANEAKFGIKSNYEETMYTTKLDKSGKDYKERERRADQLAKEIMSSTVSNSHIAEERNLIEAEGANAQTEEDKYGAVVRGANAYVPPGARRAAAAAAAATATASATARMNGASATDAEKGENANASATPSIVTTAPVSLTAGGAKVDDKLQQHNNNKDATGDFRQFVTQEKEKMERKKAALARADKENRLADLRNWSEGFVLNYPVPKDIALVTQSQQSSQSKANEKPRDTNAQKSISPKVVNGQKDVSSTDNNGSASATHSPTNGIGLRSGSVATLATETNRLPATSKLAETKAMLAKMTIPSIPPFDPKKTRARQEIVKEATTVAPAVQANEAAKNDAAAAAAASAKATFKMSAKASSFKPFNPNASTFTPGASVNTPPMRASQDMSFGMSPSPVVKPALPSNPFFGNRVIKKPSQPLHVQKEFNPFKTGNVLDASTVVPTWGFTGKPYRQLFHVIPADESASSSSHHTPQHVHANINQLGGVGGALPPGMHMPPSHLLGQQNVPAHLGMPPHQGHHGPLQPMPPHQAGQTHVQQPQHLPGPPHLGHHNQAGGMQHGNVGSASGNQPVYMPYGPYRFQHGQQPMQHLGGPYMAPQFAGQMPFSPPMPPAGAPGGMYSPQMQNLATGGNGGNAGTPGLNNGPPSRGQSAGPPHMQGKFPPHMYYQGQAGQPIPGMPYPQQFPGSAGPSPVIRHQQQQHQQQQQHPHPHHHPQQFLPSMQQAHGGAGMQQHHPLPHTSSNVTGQQQQSSSGTPVSGNASDAGSSAANQGGGT